MRTKIRSDVARAAKAHGGAGVHKDRRAPRGGTKNDSRDKMPVYIVVIFPYGQERGHFLTTGGLLTLDRSLAEEFGTEDAAQRVSLFWEAYGYEVEVLREEQE